MKKKQGLTIRPMGPKERMKYTFVLLLNVFLLTGSLFFFYNSCSPVIKDILARADSIYYNWRIILILLFFPAIGYFDVLFFLVLFVPLTTGLAQLWYKMANIIYIYISLAFIISFPLSLYIPFVLLSDYSSCATHGIFSGIQYVKDKKMCEQFEYHPEKVKPSAPLTSKTSEGKK